MAKCSVCGKKGLFLRVNAAGRCKECESAYQTERQKEAEQRRKSEEQRLEKERKKQEEIHQEEAEQRRKDEEQRLEKERKKQEEMRQEETAKRENAKKLLIEIIQAYKEIDGHIFSAKKEEDCEEFIPEIQYHIDKYYEFNDLLEKAKTTDFFQSIILDYINGKIDLGENDSSLLQVSLSNRYFDTKNVDSLQNDMFEILMRELWYLGYKPMREWEKTKESIEKAVARKKKREEKAKKKNDSTDILKSNAFPGEISKSEEKSIQPVDDEIFDTLPDCVITDIETSGLIYNRNSIIEIAAIKIVNSRIVATYSSLIHRDKELDKKITSLTGITTQMLRDCNKDLNAVMVEYKSFVEDLPLVGHNINSFDIKFINEAYIKVFGCPIKNQCVDTLKLSYEYFLEAESHKLGDLANYAGTPIETAHRALGDCETTLYLYQCMMNIAATSFLNWSKKGKSVDETDLGYPRYITKRYPTGMCFNYHYKLISSGYLESASIETVLNAFKVPELKNMLSSNSLQTTGSKQVLIGRIIENIDIQSLNLPTVYIPSQKGIEHYEKYDNAIKDMVYRHLGIEPSK